MLKIRKLYNVLVVGGMAAATLTACEHSEPALNSTPPKPNVTEAAKPEVKAEVPEVKVKVEALAPATPAAEAKLVKPAAKRAPKRAPTVPAVAPLDTGGGRRGWN